ncbi:hypothetical protein WDU94_012228 [Cyamophila willieti]
MCSEKVLTPFDPHVPVVLATDASPYGIAAVLSHTIDNTEHPIAYASRSLTSSEQNYSQLDREALALVFGVTHFYNYLYGKHFTLITDNQPLTRIFHPNKSLPQMTSARLLRYASFLSGFDYTVQFKKGKENENVDCMSRAPISKQTSAEQEIGEEVNQLYDEVILQISSNKITCQSDEFHTYCTDRGIFQKYIAPGHPATNGLAERNIQTLKNRLKTLANDSTPLHVKLQDILLRYRATPLACGQTPAELYLHRKMRIRLDAVFPYHSQPTSKHMKPVRSFCEGERVQVRLFVHNKYIWAFGTVTKCLGTRHYLVQLDTGRTIKRHINQLRSSLVPKKTVTFGPPQFFSVPQVPQSELPAQSPARQPQSPVQPESPAAHAPPQRSPRPVRNRRPIERYGNPVPY